MNNKISLFLILFLCSSFKDAFSKEIEFIELNMAEAQDSKLPDNERFFLVYKESLFLDLELNKVEKYEPLIGSLKAKTKNDLRFADISKFPETGIKKGDVISFYNTTIKKIEEFEVQENSAFKMIIDPYYPDSGRYYRTFNLVMTDPKKFHEFTHLDSFKIESIAYRGSKFKIKPTTERFKYINIGKNERESDEVNELIKAYAAKKNIVVTKESPSVSRIALGDKEIINLSFASTMGINQFYKIGNNKYLTWWHPNTESDGEEGVEFYADFIEGAEFVVIYNSWNRMYLRVVYRDRIESYFVWRHYNTM